MSNAATRVHPASDVLGMGHLADTTGKPKRTGSLTNVYESGKKTLARLNPGSSALRKERSSSPDLHSGTGFASPRTTRKGAPDLLRADNVDLEERKILRNRTRKLGKVLGETLTENEVEEHVVGMIMTRTEQDTSDSFPLNHGSEGKASRLSTLHEDQSQLRLPLGPAPFKSYGLVKELLLSSEDPTVVGITVTDNQPSLPISPAMDGMRRHSDPVSPLQHPSSGEACELHDQAEVAGNRESHSFDQAKRQRRLRLEKVCIDSASHHCTTHKPAMMLRQLNRLLGAHVPLALLGPAISPKEFTLYPENPVQAGPRPTDDDSDEIQAGQKKRAVKVAGKMLNVSCSILSESLVRCSEIRRPTVVRCTTAQQYVSPEHNSARRRDRTFGPRLGA